MCVSLSLYFTQTKEKDGGMKRTGRFLQAAITKGENEALGNSQENDDQEENKLRYKI